MTFHWTIEHFPTIVDLERHLSHHQPPSWIQGVTVHHTVKPLPHQWRGKISMQNIGTYYEKQQGWSTGPHLFIAPDGAWQGCPLNMEGVHAGICNDTRLGVEVVGYYDVEGWQEPIRSFALGDLAVLLDWIGKDAKALNGHRDCKSPKTCPGKAINMDIVRAQVQALLGGPPLPVVGFEDITADSPLLFRARGTTKQAITWLVPKAKGYTEYDITSIVAAYEHYGDPAGIDWFLAIAQMIHETGSLTSWWCQRPRRNPAGIGVNGHKLAGTPDNPPGVDWAWDGKLWREGESFASWELSVQAHLGRLLAYALPIGQGTPEQQKLIDFAIQVRPLPASYRGIAPTMRGLNGRWAVPGKTYAQMIAKIANQMRAMHV